MSSEHTPHSRAKRKRESIRRKANARPDYNAALRPDLLDALDEIDRLEEQQEAFREAVREYVRVVKEHAEAFPADDEEGFDEDLAAVVSSLGFLGTLNPGCLDPDEDELARALIIIASELETSSPSSRLVYCKEA